MNTDTEYRMLQAGERICHGDQYRNQFSGEWLPVSVSVGDKMEPGDVGVFRRPLEQHTTSALFSRVHELNLDLLLEAQQALREGRSQDAADLVEMGCDLQRIMDRLTALGHRQAQEMRDVCDFHETSYPNSVTIITPIQP